MASDACRDAEKQPLASRATESIWSAGLAVYHREPRMSYDSNQRLVSGYTSAKFALEERRADRDLWALLWWNDVCHSGVLRLHPFLLKDPARQERFRIFLEVRGYIRAATIMMLESKAGWHFRLSKGASLAVFKPVLVEYLRCEIASYRVSVGGHACDAEGVMLNEEPKQEDTHTMKLFHVLVTEQVAKSEGGEKKAGKILGGYDGKHVTAVSKDSAKTKIIAELVKADKLGDPDDPNVSIEVFGPLGSAKE